MLLNITICDCDYRGPFFQIFNVSICCNKPVFPVSCYINKYLFVLLSAVLIDLKVGGFVSTDIDGYFYDCIFSVGNY